MSGLYRSSDSGASWVQLGPGAIGSVTAIAVAPLSTIYVGAGSTLFKSVDGGSSFTAVPADFGSTISDIAQDPTRLDSVYLGTISNGVFASADAGVSWTTLNAGLTNLYVTALAVDRTGTFLHAGTGSGVFDYQFGSSACAPDATTACLQQGRFRVSVGWSAPSGQSGLGQRLDITGNSTGFWFFDPTNVELVVKVIDGRPVDGHWWVFYGALSNVEYTITVTDTQTGATRTYFNPQGQLASFADTSAFEP